MRIRNIDCIYVVPRLTFRACILALPLLAGSHFIEAAHAQDQKNHVRLHIVRQNVVSTFETLGELSNNRVQVDPAIDRMVMTSSVDAPKETAIPQYAQKMNLFFWFDGTRYVISSPHFDPQFSIPTNNVEPSVVEKIIQRIAPQITQGAIKFEPDINMLIVTGPRELRDSLIKALDNNMKVQQNAITIIKHGATHN
jgi:type II secretory pathway component GspD/PulD (secretin)